VCVYYCSTYYKAFRVGGGGHVLREPGTREEPGTLTQGGALFSLVPSFGNRTQNSRLAGAALFGEGGRVASDQRSRPLGLLGGSHGL